MIILKSETNGVSLPEGTYYAIVAAYFLTIIGFFTAFSTNIVAMVIATALLFLAATGQGLEDAKKILMKNGLIILFGAVPLVYFGFNMITFFTTPVDQLDGSGFLIGLGIGAATFLVVLVLKILVIIDFIRFFNRQ